MLHAARFLARHRMPADEIDARRKRDADAARFTICPLGRSRIRDQRAGTRMRVDHVNRLKNSFNGLREIDEIGRRGRFGQW